MILETANAERVSTGAGGLFYGVYSALVTDVVDPKQQGRVKVRLPWSPDAGGSGYEAWARLSTTMAGGNRGTWFIPDKDDEVLVAFEGGSPRCPYVVGALWNGQDQPPEQMDASGNNDVKTILSRQGVRITLDDTDGAVQLRLETPNGQSVTLSDADNSIRVEDSNGNSIAMDASGISLHASSVEIDASMVTFKSGFSTFSGPVNCDTSLQANTVISSIYQPGAGNIW